MRHIEQLVKHHNKKAFDCGNEPVSRFLQTLTNQQGKQLKTSDLR